MPRTSTVSKLFWENPNFVEVDQTFLDIIKNLFSCRNSKLFRTNQNILVLHQIIFEPTVLFFKLFFQSTVVDFIFRAQGL